jgi:hypothetical protein
VQRALALRKKLAAAEPGDRALRADLLDTYKQVAAAMRLNDQTEEAKTLLAQVYADRCRYVRERLAVLLGGGKPPRVRGALPEGVRQRTLKVAASAEELFALHGGADRGMDLVECYLDCLEDVDRREEKPVPAVRKRLQQMLEVYDKLRQSAPEGKLKPEEDQTARAIKALMDKLDKDSSKKDLSAGVAEGGGTQTA